METEEKSNKETLVGKEILTWKEGSSWIAAWVRRDFLAQGPTEGIAVDRLIRMVAVQWILSEMRNESPTDVSKPSQELIDKWTALHKEFHE